MKLSVFAACRTGEAKLTKAYLLPARHIIHTVGPRYNTKYKTAAESALYSCYRNVMEIVRSELFFTGVCQFLSHDFTVLGHVHYHHFSNDVFAYIILQCYSHLLSL